MIDRKRIRSAGVTVTEIPSFAHHRQSHEINLQKLYFGLFRTGDVR
jgi:hypothetical protein